MMSGHSGTLTKGNIVGIALALVFAVCTFVLPPESIGLDNMGLKTLGVLAITIALLISETMPTTITCFLCICLMYMFGAVSNMTAALSGFTNTTSFFVLVSFALSKAVTKMPLSNRLLISMVRIFGKSADLLLLAFMSAAAIISAFMANVATTAIFMAIALDFLNIYKDENDRKKAGRSFMIGLAIAATIGGVATPAGSSLNILALDLLHQSTGIRVTFLQWMLCGIPIALLSVPFTWIMLTKVFKIAPLDETVIKEYSNRLKASVPDKIDSKEKYVIVVILLMFILWISSSWFPKLDITLVATLGCILLFIPKYEILTFKEYMSSVAWTPYIVIATMVMVGKQLVSSGVTKWLVAMIFPDALNMGLFGMTFIVSIIIFALMVIIPSAPAIISLLAVPLVALAVKLGVTPVLFLLPLGMLASNCILFPFDTVPAITYASGLYTMRDLPKISAPVQVFLALVTAIWMPIALRILGYI